MKQFVITKSQILHLLTGLVFVPVSGFVTSWVGKNFPGLPTPTSGEVTALFITGSSAALGLGIHYLHGWQVWERTIGRVVDVEDKLVRPGAPAPQAAGQQEQEAAAVKGV